MTMVHLNGRGALWDRDLEFVLWDLRKETFVTSGGGGGR